MSIDKKEPIPDGTEEFMTSTPEAEAGGTENLTPDQIEVVSVQKRKGGRKPIYATSEERKQRNRQAQAAFRERRTEYIKQLEETIRVHETNLHSLQAAHRNAADECLMLRYKNSLLERILLEKGIDVQAELRAKTGSPSLGPTNMAQSLVQPPTVQQAIMNRQHQSRHSIVGLPPKIEPGSATPSQASMQSTQSPQSGPTPSSHASSPTSLSPGFQGVMTPPASDSHLQHSARPLKQQMNHVMSMPLGSLGAPLLPGPKRNEGSRTGSIGSIQNGYYQAPFHNNSGHLEQVYDAQNNMIGDQDPNKRLSTGPSYQQLGTQLSPVQQTSHQEQQRQQQQQTGLSSGNSGPGYSAAGPITQHLLEPFDPLLDIDPFGLSASMHFPTQFSFDTSSMRWK